MTSFRQIEANRRNDRKSTGPITEEGKQRSRCKCRSRAHGRDGDRGAGGRGRLPSVRSGVAAAFDAETAVRRELVLRLASLLWRLRRATAIDTGLLETASEPQKVSDPDGATLANERAVVGIQIAALENHIMAGGKG